MSAVQIRTIDQKIEHLTNVNKRLRDAMLEMLESAPVPHGITTDEQRERWHKALVNACEVIEAARA